MSKGPQSFCDATGLSAAFTTRMLSACHSGKRLQIFAANLFRKLCTEFRQNRPSFIEDITKKNILVRFFPGDTVNTIFTSACRVADDLYLLATQVLTNTRVKKFTFNAVSVGLRISLHVNELCRSVLLLNWCLRCKVADETQ